MLLAEVSLGKAPSVDPELRRTSAYFHHTEIENPWSEIGTIKVCELMRRLQTKEKKAFSFRKAEGRSHPACLYHLSPGT